MSVVYPCPRAEDDRHRQDLHLLFLEDRAKRGTQTVAEFKSCRPREPFRFSIVKTCGYRLQPGRQAHDGISSGADKDVTWMRRALLDGRSR